MAISPSSTTAHATQAANTPESVQRNELEREERAAQARLRAEDDKRAFLLERWRLALIGLLITGMLCIVLATVMIDRGHFGFGGESRLASWTDLLVGEKDNQQFVDIKGLSPAIALCYANRSYVSSVIIASGLGLAIGLAYFFGTFLYGKFRSSTQVEQVTFWDTLKQRTEGLVSASEAVELISSFTDYQRLTLDRRNAYWALFLRASLALVVVTSIALLIANCKIEAQAGLPIITGIIAFIIGQGSESLHGSGRTVLIVPLDRREPNDPLKPNH